MIRFAIALLLITGCARAGLGEKCDATDLRSCDDGLTCGCRHPAVDNCGDFVDDICRRVCDPGARCPGSCTCGQYGCEAEDAGVTCG